MRLRTVLTVVAVGLLVSTLAAPVAAQPGDEVDECMNADEGPGDNGPPGFVSSLMPQFLSDLFASLPVPNFVKSLFGAPTC